MLIPLPTLFPLSSLPFGHLGCSEVILCGVYAPAVFTPAVQLGKPTVLSLLQELLTLIRTMSRLHIARPGPGHLSQTLKRCPSQDQINEKPCTSSVIQGHWELASQLCVTWHLILNPIL